MKKLVLLFLVIFTNVLFGQGYRSVTVDATTGQLVPNYPSSVFFQSNKATAVTAGFITSDQIYSLAFTLPIVGITNNGVITLSAPTAQTGSTALTNVAADPVTGANITSLSNNIFGLIDYIDVEAGAMIPITTADYSATATNIDFGSGGSGYKQDAWLFTDAKTNSVDFHCALGGGWDMDTNSIKIKLEYMWQGTNASTALSNVFTIQVGASVPGEAATNLNGQAITIYPVGAVNQAYFAYHTAAIGPFSFGETITTNTTLHFKVTCNRNDANDTCTSGVILTRALIQYKRSLSPPIAW